MSPSFTHVVSQQLVRGATIEDVVAAGKVRLDPGQGLGWSIITAATLMTSGPLLIAFLLFQRQLVQSFMRAGIR
jgi:ABC-type glycerol-3-phosphate transport system permease component